MVPFGGKLDDVAVYGLGHNQLVIDKSLPRRVLGFSVRFNRDTPPPPPPSEGGHLWLQKKKKKKTQNGFRVPKPMCGVHTQLNPKIKVLRHEARVSAGVCRSFFRVQP